MVLHYVRHFCTAGEKIHRWMSQRIPQSHRTCLRMWTTTRICVHTLVSGSIRLIQRDVFYTLLVHIARIRLHDQAQRQKAREHNRNHESVKFLMNSADKLKCKLSPGLSVTLGQTILICFI